MVRSGLFRNVTQRPEFPPLSHYNAQAVAIWNRLGGEIRWPDVLYACALHDVDSLRLMIERLYALRDPQVPELPDGRKSEDGDPGR